MFLNFKMMKKAWKMTDADDIIDEHIKHEMNSLSNTEEMYLLFGQGTMKQSNNHLDSGHEADDNGLVDPHIASGVACMPDDIIDLMDSDDEEQEQKNKKNTPHDNKSNEDGAEMVTHPIDSLLEIKNSEFTNDDERLLKLMSLAIQNGAPPNLVTLYLKGHIQKSHVLNYIRTSVKHRKKVEIEISEVDFSHGYTVKDPIDLISPTSEDTTSVGRTKVKTWGTIATTTINTSLQEDPPADMRITSSTTMTENELNDTNEFKPPSNAHGNMNMKSFKDYRE